MKRIIIGLLLCLGVLGSTEAQTQPFGTSVGVSIGWGLSAYRELTYSSIVQHLRAPVFELSVNIERSRFEHSIGLRFTAGPTTSSISGAAVQTTLFDEYSGEQMILASRKMVRAIMVSLEYRLVSNLALGADGTGIPFGPSNLQASAGGFLDVGGLVQLAAYPSVSAIISLGPAASALSGSGQETVFRGRMAVPALAFVVRPPYAGSDATVIQAAAKNPLTLFATGRLLTFGGYEGIYVDASVAHLASPSTSLTYGLSAQWTCVAYPLPRIDAGVTLSSGASVDIGGVAK